MHIPLKRDYITHMVDVDHIVYAKADSKGVLIYVLKNDRLVEYRSWGKPLKQWSADLGLIQANKSAAVSKQHIISYTRSTAADNDNRIIMTMRGNVTVRTARRQTADVRRQLNNK